MKILVGGAIIGFFLAVVIGIVIAIVLVIQIVIIKRKLKRVKEP